MSWKDVPDWLMDLVNTWEQRLQLQEWDISVSMSRAPADSTNSLASCYQYPMLNKASISFLLDTENDPEAEKSVIHELIHVMHARIDQFFYTVLFPQLSASAQDIARATYTKTLMEPFVERLSQSLYLIQHPEKPEEEPTVENDETQPSIPDAEASEPGDQNSAISDQ